MEDDTRKSMSMCMPGSLDGTAEIDTTKNPNVTMWTQGRGWGAGASISCLQEDHGRRLGPAAPALPVGFMLLGHLLCQLLQDSFFQGQILSKGKAAKVTTCCFARQPEKPSCFQKMCLVAALPPSPFTPLNGRLSFWDRGSLLLLSPGFPRSLGSCQGPFGVPASILEGPRRAFFH